MQHEIASYSPQQPQQPMQTLAHGVYGQTPKRAQLNPFITATTPLLTLMLQAKHSTTTPNIDKLRQSAIHELKKFRTKNVENGLCATNCVSRALLFMYRD
jgi:type VI protein secretion system component VasF